MNKQKIIILLIIVSAGITSLFCQTEIIPETPRISEGNVINDIFYSGPVSIESKYTGEEPFIGLDKQAFYTLNAYDINPVWTGASIEERKIVHDFPLLGGMARVDSSCTAGFPDGRTIIVWKTLDGDGNQAIYFQFLDVDGNKIGGEVQANFLTNKKRISSSKPDIAVLNNGDFVIAWDGMDADSYAQYRAYGRRFDKDGNALDAREFELNQESANYDDKYYPSVMATDKEFIAVWSSRRTEADNYNARIEAYRYSYEGIPIGYKSELIQEDSNRYLLYPQITKLNETEYILMYGQVSSGHFLQKLVVQNNTLQTTGLPVTLSQASPVQLSIKVETLPDNGFVAVWSQQESGLGVRLYGQHFNDNCQALSGMFHIDNHNDNTHSAFPHVSAAADSGFVVCYRDYNFGEQQGAVMIKRYSRFMEPVYGHIVAEKDTEITAFSACVTFENRFMTVWADRVTSATYKRTAVYYPAQKRAYTPGTISPQGDIDIQFKIVDPMTQNEWFSPVRSYKNSDPGEGQNSTISYPDGYINQDMVKVMINLEDGKYKEIHFFMQRALLEDGQPGAFGEWEPYGDITTQTKEIDVPLTDGYAYKFKYTIVNMADTAYEILNGNILGCDVSKPYLSITGEQLDQRELTLNLEYGDNTSGLKEITCQVNNGIPLVFTTSMLVLVLNDDSNHIVLTASDRAGNTTTRHIFKNVEIIEPAIRILGLDDQGEYGDTVIFQYEATVPVTGPEVYIDTIFVQPAETGVVHLDLGGYEQGNHTIALRARTLNDQVLEDAVTIRLDHGVFIFVLLSPQEGKEYGTKNIPVEYWTGEPVTEVWYQLNGGERHDEMELTGLADGSYRLTVYARNSSGNQVSVSAEFTVKEVFPELSILSPINGQVCTSRDIEVIFNTNGEVSYELGEETGTITPGTILTVPEDGPYVLTLTATHPVSGNAIRETMALVVDSVEPELTIITPEPRLYGHDEINIDYRVNKPVKEITMLLNGEEVDALNHLQPGTHTFGIRAVDFADRRVEKRVDFTISRLEIVSPGEDARLVSETIPHIVPFVYDQEGEFDALTRSMDDEEGQMIVDPPGTVISIETGAGKHELELRGYLDEFKIARRNRFQIGRKNLFVGPGSIDYSYTQTGDTDNYDVKVTGTIQNDGDLDIDEIITVRFDYIRQDGFVDSYWKTINGINSKNKASFELESFRACFGDHFLITVNPDNSISGEYPGDNNYCIEFQTGQITGIISQLREDNIYLQNVSVFNTLQVDTAGAIAYVELHTIDKVFIDNTPENGFNVLADMGLLSPEINYVQVLAYGSNHVVLDSRKYYLNIKKFPDRMGGHYFPWSYVAYETSGDYNRIIMGELDLEEMTTLQGQAISNTLISPPGILPVFKEDNSLEYKIVSVDTSFNYATGFDASRSYAGTAARAGSSGKATETVDMGDVPGAGGSRKIPNGLGCMSITSFNPGMVVVSDEGIIPLTTEASVAYYNNLIRQQGENIVQALTDMILEGSESGTGLDHLDFEEELSNAMQDVYKNVFESLYWGIINWSFGEFVGLAVEKENHYYVEESAIQMTGGISYTPGISEISNHLEEIIGEYNEENEYQLIVENRYVGDFYGNMSVTLTPKDPQLVTKWAVHMFLFIPFGFSYTSDDAPGLTFSPIPITRNFEFHSAATEINFGYLLFNPVHTKYSEKIDYKGTILEGVLGRWSLIGPGSRQYDGSLRLKANARADVVYTPVYDEETGNFILRPPYVPYYAEGSLDIKIEYRTQFCIIGCWWNDWHTLYEKHRNSKSGESYTDEMVDQYIKDTLVDFTTKDTLGDSTTPD